MPAATRTALRIRVAGCLAAAVTAAANAQVRLQVDLVRPAVCCAYDFAAAPQRASAPPGRLPPDGLGIEARSGSATAQLQAMRTLGPAPDQCGFRLTASAQQGVTEVGGELRTRAEFLLVFRALQCERGALLVHACSEPSGGAGLGLGRITLDVDDDGSVDFAIPPIGGPPFCADAEFAFAVPPCGRRVRLRHDGLCRTAAFSADSFACRIEIGFAAVSPLRSEGSPCGAELRPERLADGTPVLAYLPAQSIPPGTPVLWLAGVEPCAQPLPWPPGCLQLVAPGRILAVAAVDAPAQRLALPRLLLPPGCALHVQAMHLTAAGTLQAGNRVVLAGP